MCVEWMDGRMNWNISSLPHGTDSSYKKLVHLVPKRHPALGLIQPELFPEHHYLRDLCLQIICSVYHPLLAVRVSEPSSDYLIFLFRKHLVPNYPYSFLLVNYMHIMTIFPLFHRRSGERLPPFPLPLKTSWKVFLGTLMLGRPIHIVARMSAVK